MLGTVGRGVLKRAFENSVKAIEVRSNAASLLVPARGEWQAPLSTTHEMDAVWLSALFQLEKDRGRIEKS